MMNNNTKRKKSLRLTFDHIHNFLVKNKDKIPKDKRFIV